MAGVQRGMASGVTENVRFGANEPALIMYHQALAAALADAAGGSAAADSNLTQGGVRGDD